MDEFFRELQEDMQRERWSRLWKRYGGFVLTACVALVVGAAVSVGWQHHNQTKAAERTSALLQALDIGGKDTAKGADALKSAASGESGTAAIAQLHYAGSLLKEGKIMDAATAYTQLAKNEKAEPALRDLARTLALAAAAQSRDATAADVSDSAPGSALYFSQSELKAWLLLARDDKKGANARFDDLRAAVGVPPSIQERAERMHAFLAP